MEIKDLLEIKVSYQDHFWTDIKETKLKIIFDEIKSERHGEFTTYLREFYFKGDKETYSLQKKKLPVVTFCATFDSERTKEHLKEYNSLIVLDIDKLGSSELERVKTTLLNDEYVFSFWESPSKDGIKGLVHLNFNFDINEFGIDNSHKIAFNQLVNYFSNVHSIELDKSGSDFTRLCFISQDKGLILKDKLISFKVNNLPIQKATKKLRTSSLKNIKIYSTKDVLFNPNAKNNAYHRKTIKNIINYLSKNSLSITDSYEKWLRVAFAISNSFTFDVGIRYFDKLCLLDAEKYHETECRNLLINCYENSRGEIGFSTIIYLATEAGFSYK